ncbi:MAG: aminoacyl-histidine dipeptidase [Bacteroidota bacterium]|nr:aminoacyl-histidine dipeptidase [Bacteroidota bacterium]MDX5504660.1 aminoacyl-histidine dipeptidase [Bacteroidota bacterium]
MSKEVRELEPKALWNHFSDLNAVPRPSKKEARVIQFIKEFGENLGLETFVDKIGNVIIRKPATTGMEDRTPIVMQSHLDMVHQKNNDTNFDFDSQGIDMYVDGDWVRARGTTLGADNGLGVASIMTILASSEIQHPPLEALFTIDEETGMTGAKELIDGYLKGKILLNLDTEDDDELTIGCAGGIDITAERKYEESSLSGDGKGLKITVKGLSGGHSGMDIHKGLGNANRVLVRLLWGATRNFGARVVSIDGGGLRNAIPREATSTFWVPQDRIELLKTWLNEQIAILKAEFATTDPNLNVLEESVGTPEKGLSQEDQGRMLGCLYSCPNGIYRMSPDIQDLVQTSSNLARVICGEGSFTAMCLTRSAVDSEKMDMAEAIRAAFQQWDCQVTMDGAYPGWTPKPGAEIVQIMADLYRERFKEEPKVLACHAGLECGIIGEHYPEMEMISFGPNIKGAHSPDERTQISSVQKYWDFLLETLKRIPKAS